MKMTIAELRDIVRGILVREIVRRVDGKWCLISKKGKKLGCHDKKEDAYKQEYAIQKSKERAGG